MATYPLLLCLLWIVAANAAGAVRSRNRPLRAALALVATGIPLLGLVTLQYGPVAGLLAFGLGASMLRWPMRWGMTRLFRPRPQIHPERQAQPAE